MHDKQLVCLIINHLDVKSVCVIMGYGCVMKVNLRKGNTCGEDFHAGYFIR